MKKMRSDSTFAKLSEEQRATIDDMFYGGASYEDVKSYMASLNLAVSATSCADYYQVHLRPVFETRRNNAAAAILAQEQGLDLDDAIKRTLRQRTLELALMPNCPIKDTATIYKLLLQAQAVDNDSRRIELLEKKAADADAAKEQLTRTAQSASLSPEALAQIEEAIKLL